MKTIGTLLCFLILFSCKDDKDEIDCSLFDPANPNLYIKLLDSNGNNLIENNTYKPNEITVSFNGQTITNVVFTTVKGLENLITLNVMGTEGNNQFDIKLSNSETDVLIMNLSLISQKCGWKFYKLNSVTYNDEIVSIKDESGNYSITVVK